MTDNINRPTTESEQKRPAKLGVAVAYDGSVQAQVTVRWAAAEAVRRNRPLKVVHVVDVTGLVMEAMAAPHAEDLMTPLVQAGGATVDEGADIAARAAPE